MSDNNLLFCDLYHTISHKYVASENEQKTDLTQKADRSSSRRSPLKEYREVSQTLQ